MNNEIFKSKNITVDFLGFYKYSELYLNFNLMIDNQYIRSIYVTLDDFRVNGKPISLKNNEAIIPSQSIFLAKANKSFMVDLDFLMNGNIKEIEDVDFCLNINNFLKECSVGKQLYEEEVHIHLDDKFNLHGESQCSDEVLGNCNNIKCPSYRSFDIYEKLNVKAEFRGIYEESDSTWIIDLMVENQRYYPVELFVDNLKVNGYAINLNGMTTMIPGASKFLSISTSSFAIEKEILSSYEIDSVETFEFNLRIIRYNRHGCKNKMFDDLISLDSSKEYERTSNERPSVKCRDKFIDMETELNNLCFPKKQIFKKKDIEIGFNGIRHYSESLWLIDLFVDNQSYSTIGLKLEALKVNGWSLELDNTYIEIPDYSKCLTKLEGCFNFNIDCLKRLKIDVIKNLDLKIHIDMIEYPEEKSLDQLIHIDLDCKQDMNLDNDLVQKNLLYPLYRRVNILDRNGIAVEFQGLSKYSGSEMMIELMIHNSNDYAVYLSLEKFKVNDCSITLIDNFLRIPGGTRVLSKQDASFIFDVNNLKEYGINVIEEIDFILDIRDENYSDRFEKQIYINSDHERSKEKINFNFDIQDYSENQEKQVYVNSDFEQSEAAETIDNEDLNELGKAVICPLFEQLSVCYNDDVYIEFRGIYEFSTSKWILDLMIENGNDYSIFLKINRFKINGRDIALMKKSIEVPCESNLLTRCNNCLIFEPRELINNGINKIEDINFEICVSKVEKRKKQLFKENAEISHYAIIEEPFLSAYKEIYSYRPELQFPSFLFETIFEKDNLKIETRGFYKASQSKWMVDLIVENQNDYSISLSLENFKVNNFIITLTNNNVVVPAKETLSTIMKDCFIINPNYLQDYGIDTVEEVNFVLHIARIRPNYKDLFKELICMEPFDSCY